MKKQQKNDQKSSKFDQNRPKIDQNLGGPRGSPGFTNVRYNWLPIACRKMTPFSPLQQAAANAPSKFIFYFYFILFIFDLECPYLHHLPSNNQKYSIFYAIYYILHYFTFIILQFLSSL